jgi:hypothetical protein
MTSATIKIHREWWRVNKVTDFQTKKSTEKQLEKRNKKSFKKVLTSYLAHDIISKLPVRTAG